MRRSSFCLALVGAVWIVLAILAVVGVRGAPAPLERRQRVFPLTSPAGVWRLSWGSVRYTMILTAGGRYEAISTAGVRWWGTWRMDGQTLRVSETLTGEAFSDWAVGLDERLTASDRAGLIWIERAR